MDLAGKKLVFLGDSITEGHGASSVENVYWKVLGRKTGAIVHGNGIGGTRIAPQRIPSGEPVWDRYYASRIDELPEEADAVIVFGGTNDFGHGDAPMGKMTDRDETTFYGAMHVLMQKLINKYPEAMLIVMTPLHRLSESDSDVNEFGVRMDHSLEEYVNAIMEVAAYYGAPVLDLFRTSGIQPKVSILCEKYMPDGLHPNDAGYEKIADRLIGFMKSL